MSSLAANLQSLATTAGGQAKALKVLINGNLADLSSLKTTAKGNLLAALNELYDTIVAMQAAAGATINDGSSSSTTQTYSINKIVALIAASQAALVASAPTTLDTLKELSDALGNDANFATSTATALGNRLRVDAAQGLTTGQKAQGLANLGAQDAASIGDTSVDLAAAFNAALV